MDQDNKKKIDAEDKRAFPMFIIILLISLIGGGVLGGITAMFEGDATEVISDMVYGLLDLASPWGVYVVTIVIAIIIATIYRKSKKEFYLWGQEDDIVFNKIEVRLSYAIWLVSLNTVLVFFIFSASVGRGILEKRESISGLVEVFLLVGGIMFLLLCTTVEQQKIINLEKEMNPEKQGSIYDLKFQKKWMESCDEAERLQIYRCSYKAYKNTNGLCMVLWIVCTMSGMVVDIGILPSLLIALIWGTLLTSYSIEAIRLCKNPKNIYN